jgi:spermidine synthase
MLCMALNITCAVAAMLMPAVAAGVVPGRARVPLLDRRLRVLAATGFLGIGYEVLVVRVLAQVTEDTVYTFALLLAVYLGGSAAGAAAWQRWWSRRADSDVRARWLTCALAAACLAGAALLWAADGARAALSDLLGGGMAAALGAEAGLAIMAFALPTFVMGALFSQLAADAQGAGHSFGRVLGANTLGAALAPLFFGVWAFPAWGPKFALLVVVVGYLLLALRAWRRPEFWVPAAAAVALAVWTPRLAFIDVPEGGRLVSYREGVLGAVSVVEDADGVARLRIDNRQQEGSSATLRFDARQALIPLLLHAAPRNALFLGLGTGVTSSAAARDPALEVDAVELLPEVIAASDYFTQALPSEGRLHLLTADARRYVRAASKHYDVIVADNFHPARSGAGSLYTVEHFAAIRARLAEGGLFCQWLPLHQLDLDTLRSIVRSFIAVNPDGWALLANNSLDTPVVGLVARADGARFLPDDVRRRIAAATFSPGPRELGLEDEFALFGSFIAGPAGLRNFAGDQPVNTDDHPVVTYLAPRITYAPDSLPRERLATLLGQVSIEPEGLVAQTSDTDWMHRLAAYWHARDLFIASGQAVQPTHDVHEMLAQVRAPLLSVLRESPDFRPAYDPLLMMANALARTDAGAARVLLTELAAAQPARREAQLALLALEDDGNTPRR